MREREVGGRPGGHLKNEEERGAGEGKETGSISNSIHHMARPLGEQEKRRRGRSYGKKKKTKKHGSLYKMIGV